MSTVNNQETPAPTVDEQWEEEQLIQRGLDDIQEVIVANQAPEVNLDNPDSRPVDTVERCPCGCEDHPNDDDDYDDRQDYYYDDWDTGLDWNESGYYD